MGQQATVRVGNLGQQAINVERLSNEGDGQTLHERGERGGQSGESGESGDGHTDTSGASQQPLIRRYGVEQVQPVPIWHLIVEQDEGRAWELTQCLHRLLPTGGRRHGVALVGEQQVNGLMDVLGVIDD